MTQGGRAHERHGLLRRIGIPVQGSESVDRELSKNLDRVPRKSEPDDIAAKSKARRWTASTQLEN